MKKLVFVESPTKAATLAKFLGKNYQVEATFGHIRDLPRGTFGVDVFHNFEPKYVIPKKVQKRVNQLIKIARLAKQFFLATDPDREGEAIAWHLTEILKEKGRLKINGNTQRVVFHEITPEAVKKSFSTPREVDLELVEAWKARRILDRLVGYKLSPLLWAKIKRGLSAGRVQSVALRLICERAAEIDKFKPTEYWIIEAQLRNKQKTEFVAKLAEKAGKKINIRNEKQAKDEVQELEKAEYKVLKINKKEVKKSPAAPFTTSTLQQTASSRFGYSAKRTMKIAQDLYERGQISYHRTDSVNLANSAITAIRAYIEKNFGPQFLPDNPKRYKVRSKLAQEAHEAIRPTNIEFSQLKASDWGDNAHSRLYDLIWRRTVGCQMKEAIFDETSVEILATSHQPPATSYVFKASGSIVKFPGFLQIYGKEEGDEEKTLPQLSVDEILDLIRLNSSQHFTEPPAAFTDGGLVKVLELNGIGRPSTYAPIISTLIERIYAERVDRKLIPTELGKTVNQFLVEKFPGIVDIHFTAEMEQELDDIAAGREDWIPVISKFYQPFEKHLAEVFETAEKIELKPEVTDEICPACGKKMVIRYGRFGKFLACSGFPECKTTMSLAEKTSLTCPACGGNIIVRKTRKGRTFWGCSNYPKCTFASWTRPSGAKAEEATPTQTPAQQGKPTESAPAD